MVLLLTVPTWKIIVSYPIRLVSLHVSVFLKNATEESFFYFPFSYEVLNRYDQLCIKLNLASSK